MLVTFGVSREPQGRCVAGERTKQCPLRGEFWTMPSLGWFKGQDLLGVMGGHISASSGTTKVLSSLTYLRKEGSVFHFIFVFSKNALKILSLKVWR